MDTVRSWRKRLAVERLAALRDRPRPLGQPRLSAKDKLQIISPPRPPNRRQPDTVWNHQLLSDHLCRAGLVVSASQVERILASVDLKPYLVRGWLTRPADPEFFTRAADVCTLYRTCPPNAVVISVDEKTGITARSRKHPDQPGRPGQRTRGSSSARRRPRPGWPTGPDSTSTTPQSTPAGSTRSNCSSPRSGACAAAIDTFVLAYDEHDAKPYRWAYDGTPLKAT